MLEVPENKTSLKIDQQIVLSNKYLSEQIGGGRLLFDGQPVWNPKRKV
jgi:hypothetical protein